MGTLSIGVLASGSGTLLQAILDAAGSEYAVVVVGSDVPGCTALDRAEAAGVPTVVQEFPKPLAERGPAAEALARAMREAGVELMVHAGFMKILPASYFETLGVPAMNSHPALLPSFPGAHGVRDALAHGVKVTGTTIHFATAEVDAGPIIAQEAVTVEPGDTEESLHEKIKVVERRLYVEAITAYAQGRLKVEGRRVHIL